MVFRRDLNLFLFLNPTHARSIGNQYRRAYYLLAIVLSLPPVAGLQTVGLCNPGVAIARHAGATAQPAHRSALNRMVWIAVGLGDCSRASWASYWSYWMDASRAGLHRAHPDRPVFGCSFLFCTPQCVLAQQRAEMVFL